jgi:hypothetical protein
LDNNNESKVTEYDSLFSCTNPSKKLQFSAYSGGNVENSAKWSFPQEKTGFAVKSLGCHYVQKIPTGQIFYFYCGVTLVLKVDPKCLLGFTKGTDYFVIVSPDSSGNLTVLTAKPIPKALGLPYITPINEAFLTGVANNEDDYVSILGFIVQANPPRTVKGKSQPNKSFTIHEITVLIRSFEGTYSQHLVTFWEDPKINFMPQQYLAILGAKKKTFNGEVNFSVGSNATVMININSPQVTKLITLQKNENFGQMEDFELPEEYKI